MKFQIIFTFLIVICISCGKVASDKPVDDYLRAQDLIKKHKSDIFKILENSSPEVKRESAEFVNLCLNNSEEEFLKKSGKGKLHLRKVLNNIDFFVEKIKESKSFEPSQKQINLYNKFKRLLQEDIKLVDRYIFDNNPNFNQTDKDRIRTYRAVLYNDFNGYRDHFIITEQEFQKNFNFLVSNWDQLAMELQMHYYGLESLEIN